MDDQLRIPAEILMYIFDFCPEMDLIACITVSHYWSYCSQKILHRMICDDCDHPWTEKLAAKLSRHTESEEFCTKVFYNSVMIEIGALARWEKKVDDTLAYQLELDNAVDDVELIAFDD